MHTSIHFLTNDIKHKHTQKTKQQITGNRKQKRHQITNNRNCTTYTVGTGHKIQYIGHRQQTKDYRLRATDMIQQTTENKKMQQITVNILQTLTNRFNIIDNTQKSTNITLIFVGPFLAWGSPMTEKQGTAMEI